MKVEARIAIEKRIAKKLVEDALAAGYTVSVCDGEDYPVKRSSNKKEIMAGVFSCDEEELVFRKDGNLIGRVFLVYGNDGYDVICDYSDTPIMADLLNGANELADKLEEKRA